MTRSEFRHQLLAILAFVLGMAFLHPAKADTDTKPVVILNMAADALVDYLRTEKPLNDGATQEMIIAGLHDMIDQYEDTNVTHLSFNVGYTRAAFESKTWRSYWSEDVPRDELSGWPRKYWLIHQQKVDPFAVAITRCHENKISPWVSIRMNDTHHLATQSRVSHLWWERPELRTRSTGGFEFTHPEVHQHYLSFIGELLERYDVDGVELDWMRYADLFKPQEARDKCSRLTEFMREARWLTKQASEKRARPIGLSVRVPARPEFAEGLGIDAVTWIQEGLVDIVVPCSTWNPSYPDVAVESWRDAIGRKVPEYTLAPGTDLWISGVKGGRFMKSDLETMRGFTTSMLSRGADAIYLFNHFARTDSKIWHLEPDGTRRSQHVVGDLLREAGSLQQSEGKPRRHILTYHDPVPSDAGYIRPLPKSIDPAQRAAFAIHTGPRPNTGRVFIRTGFDETPGYLDAVPKATLNGIACSSPVNLPKPQPLEPPPKGFHPELNIANVAPRVVQFEAPLTALQSGYNQVELSLAAGNALQVIWLEIMIDP